MTLSPALPVQSPSFLRWLLDCASAIANSLAAAEPARRQRSLTEAERLIYTMAQAVNDDVFKSPDKTHLRAVLEAAGRSTRLMEVEAAALQELTLRPLIAPTTEEVEADFTATWGSTRLVKECARLFAAKMSLALQSLDETGYDLAQPALARLPDLLVDFRTPPLLVALVRETFIGEVAVLALLGPRMDPIRWQCPGWIKIALIEQLRDSSLAQLRLLSLAPGFPDGIIAPDLYLNAEELDAEHMDRARYVVPPCFQVGENYVDAFLQELGRTEPAEGTRSIFSA